MLYFDRAAEYAAHRPAYPPELSDWLAEVAPRRELAWESGCGSGQLSVSLGDRFRSVLASDATAAQVAHARAHPHVAYVAATAEDAPLAGRSADLAVAAQAAHWFDLPRYWREVRRVARPDAVVALIAYGNAELDDADLQQRFVRFYHDEIGRWWPPERRIIEEGYRSIEFPFAEIEPPPLDLRATWTADQMLGYIGTWSAVRQYERAGGDARVLERFAHELRERWGTSARPVRWPMPMRVGVVGP